MSDRDYLDRYSKRTADTRIVTLIARNTDGTYTYETVDNKARGYATPANPSDFFTLNSRVEIQDPSASRTVLGAMPVIVSRAPRDQRGLSATTPDEQMQFRDGATIIALDPDPLELVAGGAAAVQIIVGSGFTGAGVYEGRGAAPDPVIADNAALIVTSTKVTRNIEADADSPLGDFDLVIDGVTCRKALRVRAPLPGEVDPGEGNRLFVMTMNAGVHLIDTLTMSVLQTFPAPAGNPRAGGLCVVGTTLYAFYESVAVLIDLGDLTSQEVAYGNAGTTIDSQAGTGALPFAGGVILGSFKIGGTNELAEAPNVLSGGGWATHPIFGGGSISEIVAVPGEPTKVFYTYSGIAKFDLSDDSEENPTPFFPNIAFGLVTDDTYLYVNRDAYVSRILLSTLAEDQIVYTDTTAFVGNDQPGQLLLAFGKLWSVCSRVSDGEGALLRIVINTMAAEASVLLDGRPRFLAADASYVYVSGDSAVHRVDPLTLAVVTLDLTGDGARRSVIA